MTRRTFIKVVGGVGAGFALGLYPSVARSQRGTGQSGPILPFVFIRIDPDETVTITVPKAEMGQGVRTSLAMLIADELDADWSKVKVENAPGDGKRYGSQGTYGSMSVRTTHKRMREVGAAARAMLVAAAAKTWGVEPSTCVTSFGKVVHPARRASPEKTMTYGQLAASAANQTPPPEDQIRLKSPAEFTIVGKPQNRVDNAAVVTGAAKFSIDFKLDGMVYAVISRPPVIGASFKSVDDAEARKVQGVIDVLPVSAGVAVIANDTWSAMQGCEALKISWDMGPNAALAGAALRDSLYTALIAHPDAPSGSKVVEAVYDFPFLAHATMEPMNAVADVRPDRCTVWAGSQAPDAAQMEVAQQLGMAPENVTFNQTLLGGGFGRRSLNDFIGEAVEVSSKIKRPVKLMWTREDDMRHDRYRPMSLHSFRGAVDASGEIVAWTQQHMEAGKFGFGGRGPAGFVPTEMVYDIPVAKVLTKNVPSPVPTHFWRSVEESVVTPVNECFLDELAHAAGADPLEFRLKLANPRVKHVLQAAAERAGWGKPLPAGSGRGIGCFSSFNSAIATIVELSAGKDGIKLTRVVSAVDVGLLVNPLSAEAQVMGACVDAIATTLSAEITIADGASEQSSWNDYAWAQMRDVPPIEVVLMPSVGETPGGLGELGYPPVVPAIANAVFAAVGKRVRKFPIRMDELV